MQSPKGAVARYQTIYRVREMLTFHLLSPVKSRDCINSASYGYRKMSARTVEHLFPLKCRPSVGNHFERKHDNIFFSVFAIGISVPLQAKSRTYRGIFEVLSPEKSRQILEKEKCKQVEDTQEQDKSSDTEQQPPFGDRKISNIQPQNRGGGLQNQQEHHIILTKYEAVHPTAV